MLAVIVVGALRSTLPYLPPRLIPALGELFGTVAFAASPKARRAVAANQRAVAPGRRPRVRRTFVEQSRHYLDTFQLFRTSPARIDEWVAVEHWERFVEAHARGRGVVLASAHFGPVNVSGQLLRARGYEVHVPVEEETGAFSRAVNQARAAMGGRVVPTSSARGIYRILRQGGVLGLMADRAVTGTGEWMPFFGRQALLPSAHVALALRAEAPIVPAFAYREGDRMRVIIEPALWLERSGDHDADVRDGVRRFVAIMERHIASRPEAWTVFHPFWDG